MREGLFAFPEKRRIRHERENRIVGFGSEPDDQLDGAGRTVDGCNPDADARGLGGGV